MSHYAAYLCHSEFMCHWNLYCFQRWRHKRSHALKISLSLNSTSFQLILHPPSTHKLHGHEDPFTLRERTLIRGKQRKIIQLRNKLLFSQLWHKLPVHCLISSFTPAPPCVNILSRVLHSTALGLCNSKQSFIWFIH